MVGAEVEGRHWQNFAVATSPILTFSSCRYPYSSGAHSAVVFRALKKRSFFALSRYSCLSMISVGTFCLIHSTQHRMAFVCLPALLDRVYLLSSVVVMTVLRPEFIFSVNVLMPCVPQAASTVDFAASNVDCVSEPAARLVRPILYTTKQRSKWQ